MRNAVRLSIFCLLAVACSDETHPFDPPLLEGAKSLILVFDLAPPRAFAVDPEDETQTVAFYFDGGEVAVYALLYDRTLAELELDRGELALVAEGRALPATDRAIQRAIVGSGVKQPWADVEPPSLLQTLRIRGDAADLCVNAPRFTLETHQLDTKTNGRDAIALDDGTVLLTAIDGTFYQIGPGTFAKKTLDPNIPSGAVYRAPDGALWFAGRDGMIVETVNDAIVSSTIAPTRGNIQRLAGPNKSNAAFELLLLDFSTSSLMRYDGTRFTELVRDFEILIGDVAWTAPNQGYATLGTRSQLTVIDGDRTTAEDLAIGNVGVDALAIHPEHGPFVGTVNGRLLYKKDGQWIGLGDLGANVEAIAPYGEGVVLGGTNGFFGYWSESTGLCVEQLLPETVEKLVIAGEDIAVTMLNHEPENPELSDVPTYATWMRRTR